MRSSGALLLVLSLALPASASGQTLLPVPVSVELRLGIGVPLGDLTETDPGIGAEPGPMIGAGAAAHLTRGVEVRAGYSRTSFGCTRCGQQGLEDRLVDDGADAAVRLTLPMAPERFEPWILLGGLYHQATFSDGEESLSSEPAFGFEVGGGLDVGLPRGIRAGPEIRFRTYPAELDLGGLGEETVDISHILLGVGISYRF